MTAAMTKEERKPRGAAEVAAFQKKYEEALEEAQISAQHTATEGWQQLYEQHRTNIEKRRKQLGADLHNVATAIERGDMGEDIQDSIGGCKKAFAALCTDAQVFEKRVVEPVKEAMFHCHEIIEQARREARSLESTSPLIAKGVLESIELAIGEVEKVTFDEKTGRVQIRNG